MKYAIAAKTTARRSTSPPKTERCDFLRPRPQSTAGHMTKGAFSVVLSTNRVNADRASVAKAPSNSTPSSPPSSVPSSSAYMRES